MKPMKRLDQQPTHGATDPAYAEGTACDDGRGVADRGLQAAPCGGENGERKVG